MAAGRQTITLCAATLRGAAQEFFQSDLYYWLLKYPIMTLHTAEQWLKLTLRTVQNMAGMHIDALVQERCNSSALAMKLHLSCSNPSISRTDVLAVTLARHFLMQCRAPTIWDFWEKSLLFITTFPGPGKVRECAKSKKIRENSRNLSNNQSNVITDVHKTCSLGMTNCSTIKY